MNRFIRKILPAVAALLMAGNVQVSAQRAVTVDSTDLPVAAKTFLNKNFDGIAIHEFEKKFWSNSYELELADGTDIDFDSRGHCTEVSAPDYKLLDAALVRELLPAAACLTLTNDNLIESVEEIEYNPSKGYKVEVRHGTLDDYRFDIAGKLIKVTHDD